MSIAYFHDFSYIQVSKWKLSVRFLNTHPSGKNLWDNSLVDFILHRQSRGLGVS